MFYDIFHLTSGQGAPNTGEQDLGEVLYMLCVFLFGVLAFLFSLLMPFALVSQLQLIL